MHVGVAVATAFLLALIIGAGGRAPGRAHRSHAAGCGTTQVCPMDGRSLRYVISFRVAPPRH